MKIVILSQKQNKLLNRTEIKGEIFFEGATPKRWDMKIEAAKHLKVNPSLLVIKKVRNVFGERKVDFTAHLYKSEKELSIISKVLLKKNQKPEEKAPEEQSSDVKEAKPAEQPIEKAEAKEEQQPEETQAEPNEKRESEAKPAKEAKEEKPAEKGKEENQAEAKQEADEEKVIAMKKEGPKVGSKPGETEQVKNG